MALSEPENGCSGGDEGDSIVRTSVLGGFSESGEIRALMSSLSEVHGDMVSRESAIQKFLGEAFIHTEYEVSINVKLMLWICGFNFLEIHHSAHVLPQ